MQEQLQALYNGEVSVQEVYKHLEPETAIDTRALKRARYVKMRIRLPEESLGLNALLKILFGLPLPMFIARFILRKTMYKSLQHPNLQNQDIPLDLEEIEKLIKYSKGTTIMIESKDANIKIKIR